MHLNFLLRLVGPELAPLRRMLVVLLWLAVLAIVLAGCGVQRGALASAASHYCEQTPATRELMRAALNAQIAPNRVAFTCAADVDPAAPAPPE